MHSFHALFVCLQRQRRVEMNRHHGQVNNAKRRLSTLRSRNAAEREEMRQLRAETSRLRYTGG